MKKFVFIFILALNTISMATITENFEDGYGILDQVSGNGGSYITYNSSEESLDGTFYRSSERDFRYALLGDTINGANSDMAFSTVITPISSNGTNGNHGAVVVGFLNSETWDRVSVVFNYSPTYGNRIFLGYSYDSETKNSDNVSYLNFDFGTTYFIDAYLDSDTSLFSADVYEGIDGTGLCCGNISYVVEGDCYVNALGCGNAERGGVSGYYFDAQIHEISMVVPSPAALPLAALGGLFLRKIRKY